MSLYDVTPISAEDYRRRAKLRLPRFLYDYIDGGANDEVTMADNVSDFRDIRLKQRVMRDVSNIDTSTVLSGRTTDMPVVLAPVGFAGMFARRGEVQGALAANAANIPFTTSTLGICPVEEIAEATGSAFWFQLYMLRDRGLVEKLLERAQAAGCDTLMFTVDLPVAGMRLRDYRNGMLGGGVPGQLSKIAQILTSPLWVVDVGLKGKPHNLGNLREAVTDPDNLDTYKAFVDSQFDPSVTWEDIAWLRKIWPGKLLIKGVLEADDAHAAVDVGADGVIVSNHGGRQLDGVASGISKLPHVAAAVGDRTEVYVDGGVRGGIDVVKALALGAKGVLIGRPWVWAIGAGGQSALSNLLDVFQREISTAMALMGVSTIEGITSDLVDR